MWPFLQRCLAAAFAALQVGELPEATPPPAKPAALPSTAEQMGCGISRSVSADHVDGVPPAALPSTAEQIGLALLEALQVAPERPSLPVKPHADRLKSGARGVSLAFLRAVRDYYAARDGLGQMMGDVCKKGESSVCTLSRSTGLSLAESVVLVADKRGKDAGPLIGSATSFFSYRWTASIRAALLSSACSRSLRSASSRSLCFILALTSL